MEGKWIKGEKKLKTWNWRKNEGAFGEELEGKWINWEKKLKMWNSRGKIRSLGRNGLKMEG